jgi:ligand-binding sensor domain-containing protein
MKIYLFLFLFFLNFSQGLGQPLELNFKSLNSKVAISNDATPYVFKDSKGLLWISTFDGVNVCDGLTIQVYKQEGNVDENSTNGFYGSIIQGSFFEDNNSDIWFTTFNAINCYRRNKKVFEHFFLVDERGEKIQKSYQSYILDSKSKFWIQTQSNGQNKLYTFDTQNFQQSSITIIDRVIKLEENNTSLFLFNALSNKLSVIEIVDYKVVKQETVFNGKSKNTILFDTKTFKDNLFIASSDGLFSYNNERKKEKKLLSGYFTSILVYQKKYLLLTSPEGITIYNILNNQVERFLSSEKLGVLSTISNLYLDNDDGLWATHKFGTSNVYYANIKKNPFKIVNLPSTSIPFISNRLCINKENKLFAINKNCDAIIVLNAANRTQITTIPLPKHDANMSFNSILVDSDNTIWFSTKSNLYCCDNSLKWKKIKLNFQKNVVWNIKEVSNKRILLCTEEGIYNVNKQGIEKITIIPTDGMSIVNLFEDSKGFIHYSLDANEYVIAQFKTKDTIEIIKKIALNGFFANHWEDDKNIWLGTNLGIASIDKESYTLAFHNQHNKLAPQFIVDMLHDKAGNLWTATNKGLVAYNTTTKLSRTFDSSTDLFSDDFLMFNASQAQSGELYFGSEKAVIYFNPDDIKPSEYKSPVHITSFKINDIERNNLNANNLSEITLKNNENNIHLQFVAIDFTNPEKTRVAYILDGWDNQWDTSLIANGAARYSNLSHGTYRLKIASCNTDGFWSPEQYTIIIHVLPPFYLTWWFLALSAIVITSLGHFLNRLQIKRVRAKEREKGELLNKITNSELKALKAQMNPHFVNNCLNSISNFILKNDNDNAFFYLTKFSRMMRMVLDHSNVDFVKLKDEITALTYYIEMESLRFSALFTYKIEVDEDIDTEQTLISPMLIQPFVENAIWHGLLPQKQGTVTIQFKKDKNFMQCTIEDNGVGRKKSTETKGDEYKTRKSYGMALIQDRLDILNKTINQASEPIEIIDRYDDLGNALGTKIIMKIPTQNQY